MAKPLSKKIKKNVKKARKSVQKSLNNLGTDSGPSTAAMAGLAVAGAAGVAGVAAAIHFLRKGPRDSATLHVAPKAEGWVVEAEGSENPVNSFETKKEALDAARKMAHEAAPSDLVIHSSDGAIQESHSYEAD